MPLKPKKKITYGRLFKCSKFGSLINLWAMSIRPRHQSWIVLYQFCWIRFYLNLAGRGLKKEKKAKGCAGGGGRGAGGDYFKYFRLKGAIIRGRRLIEGRLLFEEIRYLFCVLKLCLLGEKWIKRKQYWRPNIFTRKLKYLLFWKKKKVPFLTFHIIDQHINKKVSNFAFCSMKSEYRNLIFLLFSTSISWFFWKKVELPESFTDSVYKIFCVWTTVFWL